MNPVAAFLRWVLAPVLLTLLAAGCNPVVVACAADGTCPQGLVCVKGLCKQSLDGAGQADAETDVGKAHPTTCLASGAGGPSPRSNIAGGVVKGRMLVLSGDEGAGNRCGHTTRGATDTWQLIWCKGWSVSKGKMPSARSAAASVSSPEQSAVYVYGGRFRKASTGAWILRADLWRLEGSEMNWQRLASAGPPPRADAALGLRRSTNTLYLFGGNAAMLDGSDFALSDLWAFDQDNSKWQRLHPVAGPKKRFGHVAAVSDDDRFLVVFGGVQKQAAVITPMNDTWRLDLDKGTWQQISAGTGAPTGRLGAGLLRYPGFAGLLLFGGRDGSQIDHRNDLWTIDPVSGAWQMLRTGDLGAKGSSTRPAQPVQDACAPPAGFMQIDLQSPERRRDFIWGVDPGSGRIWLFGGRGDCGPMRDAWTLHIPTLTWQLHEPSTAGWSCLRNNVKCASLCAAN